MIRPFTDPKMSCLYHINIWCNLLDPFRKIQTMMRMKVDINKGICPDFGRNILDDCRDYHDDLPLVYPSMILPPHNNQ